MSGDTRALKLKVDFDRQEAKVGGQGTMSARQTTGSTPGGAGAPMIALDSQSCPSSTPPIRKVEAERFPANAGCAITDPLTPPKPERQ